MRFHTCCPWPDPSWETGPLQKPTNPEKTPFPQAAHSRGDLLSNLCQFAKQKRYQGSVACICMPLMTIEFEHLFICLLAIYVNKSLTFMEPLKNARRPPPSGAQRPEPWARGGRGGTTPGRARPPASEGSSHPTDAPTNSAPSVHPQPSPLKPPLLAPNPLGPEVRGWMTAAWQGLSSERVAC